MGGMKTTLIIVAVLVVLLVAAGVGIRATAAERAETARRTLEEGADRFVACHERDGSYQGCRTGSSRINVAFRSRDAFSLTYAADFAATYTIARERGGELKHSCHPRSSFCPIGRWKYGG